MREGETAVAVRSFVRFRSLQSFVPKFVRSFQSLFVVKFRSFVRSFQSSFVVWL